MTALLLTALAACIGSFAGVALWNLIHLAMVNRALRQVAAREQLHDIDYRKALGEPVAADVTPPHEEPKS